MKKIYQLLALITILVSGCSQDEVIKNQSSSSNSLIYTASFEGSESRTYLNENGYLRWTAYDQISIFEANTYNQQYQFTGETGDNTGTFEKVSVSYATGTDLSNHYAIYPYNPKTKISETGVITTTIPAEQTYAVNSFGLGDNTMVAVTADKNDTFLKFKNVGGYLELKLYGNYVTVKSITLEGNSNEKIAGTATIAPVYGGTPSITMADDAVESIELVCGKGVTIGTTVETATAFLLVVPPTTFERGFTITITDINGDEFIQSTSKNIEIKRNIIQPMNAFEVECKKVLASSYSNGIAYVAKAGELSSIIPEDEKLTITSLNISGYLNGNDIMCLRRMLGGTEWNSVGRLTTLDLSEARIVEGGGNYYSSFKTSNDVIGKVMFARTKLKKLIMPASVTAIDEEAFFACHSLISIDIPDGVTSIGNSAFSSCTSLKSVYIEDLSAWCNITFGTSTSNPLNSNGGKIYLNNNELTELIIPADIKQIKDYAFWRCESITKVTMGEGVKVIGSQAFYGCTSLKSVYIEDLSAWCNITFTSSISNPLCYGAKLYLNDKELTELAIPTDVKQIKNYAFYGYKALTKVTMGEAVTSVGIQSFRNCSSLTQVYCQGTTPPTVNASSTNSSFNGSSSNKTLYVPKGYSSAYQSSVWVSFFGAIKEMD